MAQLTDRFGSYSPGSWTLMCGKQTWLLGEIEDDPEAIQRLWSLLDGSASLDDVLAAVESSGEDGISSFALIHLAPGKERAVVRGSGRITLSADGQEIALSSPVGATKWLEYPIGSDDVAIELSSNNEHVTGASLPISSGVARATSAKLDCRSIGLIDDDARESSPPTDEAGPQTPADGSAPYDFLFENTQRGTVEDAAVRVAEEEPPSPQPPVPAESIASPVDDPAATLLGDPVEALVLDGEAALATSGAPLGEKPGGLIVAVPGVPSRQDTFERTTEPIRFGMPGASDVDERTVTRARIGSIAHVGDDLPGGPAVKAIPCPEGHANPPHNSKCRICGAEIVATTPITVPRPVLGVLRLSTGDAVPLDRGAVIGRSPELPATDEAERPHVVRVPSPDKDVSRNHLEVTLDGWHVLVTDLRSTNGTLVTVPGEEPQRLRPDEAFPIPPGTVVSLADEVSFVYEVGD